MSTSAVSSMCVVVMAVSAFPGSANGEDASHAGGGMSGLGAEVAVPALLLERDDAPRCLAGLKVPGRLAVDLEVVHHVADVLEPERDGAGPRDRLRRQLEGELLAGDLDRRRDRARPRLRR